MSCAVEIMTTIDNNEVKISFFMQREFFAKVGNKKGAPFSRHLIIILYTLLVNDKLFHRFFTAFTEDSNKIHTRSEDIGVKPDDIGSIQVILCIKNSTS